MRLREIAPDTLDEGILGNLGKKVLGMPEPQGSIDQRAADAAQKLQAKGVGQQSQPLTASQAIANVQQNAAQQQFIKGLVAQWTKEGAKKQPPVTEQDTPISGVTPGKPSPAEYAKLQQKIAAASGATAPAKTTTAATPPPNAYQSGFEQWAAEKLRTVVPQTSHVIDLDDVKKSDIGDELARALAQVVSTANNAQQNAAAVNNYLTIAVAGISMLSAEIRQSIARKQPVGAVRPGQSGQAIVTQQDMINKLTRDLGMNATQIDGMKKFMQNPAEFQALQKLAGIRS